MYVCMYVYMYVCIYVGAKNSHFSHSRPKEKVR